MNEDYQARLVAGGTQVGDEGQELSLRPQSFNELVGQTKLVSNLKVYVAAAIERGEALDHTLLAGPPGLGKTTIANLLANELGVDLHVTSGPAIERKDLAGILSHLKERDVLFIDEIHRLSPVVEENLYPAMEDFKFDIILGGGAHARSIEMPLPRFTLVGATTRSGLLTGPMRDRFGIAGRMEYYTREELTQVVTRSAKILDMVCDPQGAIEIARRSRGTPRIANRLLRRVRDFAQVKGNGEVDLEMAQYALERLEIDEHGFDEMDRKLLSTLIHKFGGGPVGVETLAAAMGEEPDTLESVYEPYLLQEGFIQRTPRGRMATANSYSYLGVTPPTHAVGQGKLFQISGDQDAHKSA